MNSTSSLRYKQCLSFHLRNKYPDLFPVILHVAVTNSKQQQKRREHINFLVNPYMSIEELEAQVFSILKSKYKTAMDYSIILIQVITSSKGTTCCIQNYTSVLQLLQQNVQQDGFTYLTLQLCK